MSGTGSVAVYVYDGTATVEVFETPLDWRDDAAVELVLREAIIRDRRDPKHPDHARRYHMNIYRHRHGQLLRANFRLTTTPRR